MIHHEHTQCTSYHIIPDTHNIPPQLAPHTPPHARAIPHRTTFRPHINHPRRLTRSRDGYTMAGALLRRSSPPPAAQKKRKAAAPENSWPVSPCYILRTYIHTSCSTRTQQCGRSASSSLSGTPTPFILSTCGTCCHVPSI